MNKPAVSIRARVLSLRVAARNRTPTPDPVSTNRNSVDSATRRQWAFGLAGLATAPLVAQFTSSVQVVNVFVTVRDKQGKLVAGLKQSDFQLSVDGRSQPIRYFSNQSDLQLTLGLLFDISGSQRAVIEQQRSASETFLRQVLRPEDQALILAFDRNLQLLQPQTNAHTELASALAKLNVPRTADGKLYPNSQGTALFDAIASACRLLESEPGRKAIVLMSDGIDTTSSIKLNTAMEAAQRADVLVYPIRFYDRKVFAFDIQSPATERLKAGARDLQKLATQTGGTLFEISDQDTLEGNFKRIEDELRNQYSLGFSPPTNGTSYHKLKVRLNPKSTTQGLSLQARDGYFGTE